MNVPRSLLFLAGSLALSQLCGCAFFHNLQPHRLRMLNRGTYPSLDPNFITSNGRAGEASIVARTAADPRLPMMLVRGQSPEHSSSEQPAD